MVSERSSVRVRKTMKESNREWKNRNVTLNNHLIRCGNDGGRLNDRKVTLDWLRGTTSSFFTNFPDYIWLHFLESHQKGSK